MNRRKYRQTWLRLYEKYTRLGFKVFSRAVEGSLDKIPWEDMTEDNYEFFIKEFVTTKPFIDAYEEFYTAVGLEHGNRVGKAINREQKLFNPFNFESAFRQFIKNLIANTFGQKITSIRSTFIETVIDIIAEGFDRNDSPVEIARDVREKVGKNNLYRWQALRIARTETTGAANLGAKKASEESGVELEKEWISTVDRKTRRRPPGQYDHLDMDGVTVDENAPFNVDGDLIQFPGDPNGQPGNIINCRCTVAYLVKRDSEGRIIRKPQQ